MTQEDANNLNKEQAIKVGEQLAFPLSTGSGYHPNRGLTKKEHIAIQLMAALMSSGLTPEDSAPRAIRGTEVLLIELNKK
jgi:hypothetical protein